VIFPTQSGWVLTYAIGLLVVWLFTRWFHSPKIRQPLFLAASYLFYYSWGSRFLAVLLISSVVNYLLGVHLRRRLTSARLWLGISFNLLLLGGFKYLPLIGVAYASNSALANLSHIALPVGISFWTFQAISYHLDLYREEQVDPSLLEFCLYMAFWPTVLSGPICRLPAMLPQFRETRVSTWDEVGRGTQRILIGILMMAVSQVLAVGVAPGQGVDGGFGRAADALSGTDVWCLAIGYGFQLFFNFAGYSQVVIGVAMLFGIRLHENFNRPYLSASPSTFWTRWHMSLSFWIRDYVFFPLATLRRELWWRNLSLIIAMFVFGLWHKGSLLFMLWGIYHGILLVLHRQWEQLRLRGIARLPRPLLLPFSWLVTFGGVSLGWIFFRAESTHQAAIMYRLVFSPASYAHTTLPLNFYRLTFLAMIGYFFVVGVGAFLDRCALGAQSESYGTAFRSSRALSSVMSLLARDRWVWVIPIAVVLSFYVLSLLHPRGPLVGPMMYQIF
jgi:alginate O-acetyltransferase complex protein AlgI